MFVLFILFALLSYDFYSAYASLAGTKQKSTVDLKNSRSPKKIKCEHDTSAQEVSLHKSLLSPSSPNRTLEDQAAIATLSHINQIDQNLGKLITECRNNDSGNIALMKKHAQDIFTDINWITLYHQEKITEKQKNLSKIFVKLFERPDQIEKFEDLLAHYTFLQSFAALCIPDQKEEEKDTLQKKINILKTQQALSKDLFKNENLKTTENSKPHNENLKTTENREPDCNTIGQRYSSFLKQYNLLRESHPTWHALKMLEEENLSFQKKIIDIFNQKLLHLREMIIILNTEEMSSYSDNDKQQQSNSDTVLYGKKIIQDMKDNDSFFKKDIVQPISDIEFLHYNHSEFLSITDTVKQAFEEPILPMTTSKVPSCSQPLSSNIEHIAIIIVSCIQDAEIRENAIGCFGRFRGQCTKLYTMLEDYNVKSPVQSALHNMHKKICEHPDKASTLLLPPAQTK